MDINELINNTIDNYWNWRLLDIPEFATFVGEHKYDDRLMDMSLNGYLRRRDDAKTWLEEAHKIRKLTEKNAPSNECQIHLDYLQHDTKTFLEGLTHTPSKQDLILAINSSSLSKRVFIQPS